MEKIKLNDFLKDMSYNTKYSVLDYGKDKSEVDEIAANIGYVFPNNDLAIFKGRYAYVDRQNLNGCTLPKAEVEQAVGTLRGKAVDFDHLRKRVVGHWIDAKIENDEIIAYGVFYKGNFDDDYAEVKTMMENDVLGISFEAWGNREFKGDGGYNLLDIEFAGGALLMKTEPAFPGSEVIEMSKVMEFAKVMTAPNEFVSAKEKEKGEAMNKHIDWKEDAKALTDTIKKNAGKRKVTCASCEWTGLSTELAKSTKCPACGGRVDLVSDIASTGGKEMDEKLIREYEEKIEAFVKAAMAKGEEFAKVKTELAQAQATIDELKKESEEAKVKIEEIEKTKAEEIAKVKVDATKIAERKAELAGIEISDEDLLDDAKYELAKVKKQLTEKDAEIAKLKEGKKEDKDEDEDEGKEEGKKAEKDLDKGSKDKDMESANISTAKKVQGLAWGDVEEKEEE